MQTVSQTKELSIAMSSVENLLNGKDGQFVIEAIRKFKKYQTLDTYTLQELNHRLSK